MSPFLDFDHLHAIAEREAERYRQASPFPHIVLDDVAHAPMLMEGVRQFPKPSELAWYTYDNPLEKKLALPHIERLPPLLQEMLHAFNSSEFTAFLERLTGITGLCADPEFYGGGLHQIERGGKLDIHADFNVHPHSQLDRRINAILYMNPGWKPEYGGHLELWDAEMTRACCRVLPTFNRLVIFNTTDWSYHGHPEPLQCPEHDTRKSIALYYYSKGRPACEQSPPHSTLYQRRPTDPPDAALNTLRRERAKGRLTARRSAT
jgi:2OG-Fe(II) oxygenase superfamily